MFYCVNHHIMYPTSKRCAYVTKNVPMSVASVSSSPQHRVICHTINPSRLLSILQSCFNCSSKAPSACHVFDHCDGPVRMGFYALPISTGRVTLIQGQINVYLYYIFRAHDPNKPTNMLHF